MAYLRRFSMTLTALGGALVIGVVRLYQALVSPRLARWVDCRYYPSCSEYAVRAVHSYGLVRGLIKMLDRLSRCRPDNYETCIDYP